MSFDPVYRPHKIKLNVDDIIGDFSDYSITKSDVLFETKPIEVYPNKWVDPLTFLRLTECHELDVLTLRRKNNKPIALDITHIFFSVFHALERLKRYISNHIQENDFNEMISYPHLPKGDSILLKNPNDIWLAIRYRINKWDFDVELSLLLAMYKYEL